MEKRTKIIILISLVTVMTGYIIYRKISGNKIYEELMKNLQSGANKTGTTKDIKEGSRGWNSVTYWATAKPDLKNKATYYENIAKDIYSKISNLSLSKAGSNIISLGKYILTSGSDVYDAINKNIKTQAEASYVSYWYIKVSNSKQTFLQGINSLNQDIAKQIVTYLNSLK